MDSSATSMLCDTLRDAVPIYKTMSKFLPALGLSMSFEQRLGQPSRPQATVDQGRCVSLGSHLRNCQSESSRCPWGFGFWTRENGSCIHHPKTLLLGSLAETQSEVFHPRVLWRWEYSPCVSPDRDRDSTQGRFTADMGHSE